MSTVFLPSNGSMVLPPTNRSYGYPVQHAAYPTTHTMMPGMMPGMAPMQAMRPMLIYGSPIHRYDANHAVPRRDAHADDARSRVHIRDIPVLRLAAAAAYNNHHPKFIKEAQKIEFIAFVSFAQPFEEQRLLLSDLERWKEIGNGRRCRPDHRFDTVKQR
ncbi:hypothetical protein BDN71DRAFT_1511716 [Pleurotus eryngii]|uniref:Uncharacterized protein n=1 Tax=Pleurotus eryngii TaxID=5323 RepID=A0A9P5ZNL8_PLEER|nr:hypothetical protein BDN71DRAFT_1511716 [Pleurotus eryngii]